MMSGCTRSGVNDLSYSWNQQYIVIVLYCWSMRRSTVDSWQLWNTVASKRMWSFKLYCNVFCEPTEWIIYLIMLHTDTRAVSHQMKWARVGMTMESPYFFWAAVNSIMLWVLQVLYSILESWFNIYPLLALKIADTVIFLILVRC